MMERYFPLYISLQDREVLVVGGGTVAARRTRSLLPFGCRITAVAPDFSPDFPDSSALTRRVRCFEDEDLQGVFLAVIATNDPQENERIAALCTERGIIKNVASDMNLCDFRFPALALSKEMTVGLCSTERRPALTKQIRRKIQEFLNGYREEN